MMIEERTLGTDELWAVIRDQRERVERLVGQAERLQTELATARGENRRLSALLAEREAAEAEIAHGPREDNPRPEIARVIDEVVTPALEEAPSAAVPVRSDEHTRPIWSARVATRALMATIVIALCIWTAIAVPHSSSGSAAHSPQVAAALHR